jgi:succinyl-CoA synthetase alpha subunit
MTRPVVALLPGFSQEAITAETKLAAARAAALSHAGVRIARHPEEIPELLLGG